MELIDAKKLDAIVRKVTTATEIEDHGKRELFSTMLRDELHGIATGAAEALGTAHGSIESLEIRLRNQGKTIADQDKLLAAAAAKLVASNTPDPPLWALDLAARVHDPAVTLAPEPEEFVEWARKLVELTTPKG